MRFRPRLGENWRAGPLAIFAIALFLLLAGTGVILQNEATYRAGKIRETQVQADILAATVAAALDFADREAAQEAVNAFRANRQVRWVGIYDAAGAPFAGYVPPGGAGAAWRKGVPPVAAGGVRAMAPVTTGDARIGTVFLDVEREPLSRRLARYLLLAFLIVLAALVVVVLGIAQTALRQANRALSERAEALAEANALLEAQMEERARAEEQLRQSQKMQALGQLTGGIAHDFNNLLTVIQGSADLLCRDDLADEKRLRFARAIVQASASAAALTSQLLAFARRQPLKPEAIDVNAFVAGTRDLLDRTLGERIIIETRLSSDACDALADRSQLEAAVLNIAANARDAMPDGGRLTIATRALSAEDGATVEIEIADTGTGMDQDTLEHVFEPFFTTKGLGKGTGLGLSQVYGFAQQSGGEVRVRSEPGVGTAFTLVLPCADRQEPAATAQAVRPGGARVIASILVVEDNEEVGAFAEALLRELGHGVARARSGEDALELVRTQPFDIVFSDVVMPGMGGLRLAEILGEEHPELPVVLATGYSHDIAQSGTGGRPLILKPYRLETLSRALDAALGAARPEVMDG
jgi:signal transduction histidine kinase/CheY-like chemotaxis protein